MPQGSEGKLAGVGSREREYVADIGYDITAYMPGYFDLVRTAWLHQSYQCE